MKYRKINVHEMPYLAKYVDFIYEITNNNRDYIYKTLPNNNIGISIVLSGNAKLFVNNSWREIPSDTIYGLIKNPHFVKLNSNFREIAIIFKPYNLKMFLDDKITLFSQGKTVNLEDAIDPYLLEQFRCNLMLAKTDKELLRSVKKFIISQEKPYNKKEESEFAYNLIVNKQVYNVKEIAKELGVSTASVRNLFNDNIGVSPKKLIRICRVNNALKSDLSNEAHLTSLCYELGYYDQSHFINEFKSVLNLTPKEYFNNKNLIFDFSNFGRWKYDNIAGCRKNKNLDKGFYD